jgi:hypothetical protein
VHSLACGNVQPVKVGDEVIEFNFHIAMKYPYNKVYSINVMTKLISVQQVFDFKCEDGLSVTLSYSCDFTEIEKTKMNIYVP